MNVMLDTDEGTTVELNCTARNPLDSTRDKSDVDDAHLVDSDCVFPITSARVLSLSPSPDPTTVTDIAPVAAALLAAAPLTTMTS
jgi:hypothetical protein